MLTVAEQNAARARTIQSALINAVGLNGGNVDHASVAVRDVLMPAICGGMFALPNFTDVRPSYTDAQRYAERLINRAMDANSAYCVYVDPNAEWGGAVNVGVAFGAEVYVVTVWYEDGELYGEW